jgi:hypothetical protein
MPSNEELNKEKDKKQENPSIGVSETSTEAEIVKSDISQNLSNPNPNFDFYIIQTIIL